MLHASLIKLFVHCSNHNEIFDSKDKEIYFYKVIQAFIKFIITLFLLKYLYIPYHDEGLGYGILTVGVKCSEVD